MITSSTHSVSNDSVHQLAKITHPICRTDANSALEIRINHKRYLVSDRVTKAPAGAVHERYGLSRRVALGRVAGGQVAEPLPNLTEVVRL